MSSRRWTHRAPSSRRIGRRWGSAGGAVSPRRRRSGGKPPPVGRRGVAVRWPPVRWRWSAPLTVLLPVLDLHDPVEGLQGVLDVMASSSSSVVVPWWRAAVVVEVVRWTAAARGVVHRSVPVPGVLSRVAPLRRVVPRRAGGRAGTSVAVRRARRPRRPRGPRMWRVAAGRARWRWRTGRLLLAGTGWRLRPLREERHRGRPGHVWQRHRTGLWLHGRRRLRAAVPPAARGAGG